MKKPDVKFLGVVDDRWPGSCRVIIYTGKLRPYKDGFLYSFEYGTGKGQTINGAGIVQSEKYSKMSSEEIELTCSIANPLSPGDVYRACMRGDMTKTYAEKYSGVKGGRPGDAG